jgi:putative NADPH-quinone reductase
VRLSFVAGKAVVLAREHEVVGLTLGEVRTLAPQQGPSRGGEIHPHHRPKDAAAQWDKVKAADGLAFIAPVYWLHFPAILKGWFERVFAYGDAYALTPEGWSGEAKGRVPLLHHQKARVISTTLFNEANYKTDWEPPMTRIIDDWGLRILE